VKKIEVKEFGITPNNKIVNKYTLSNENGMELTVLSYGGIVQSLKVPDRNGKVEDVVLGFDTLDDYVHHNSPYFGAIIGRFGNRIAKGKFSIDGVAYNVAQNNGDNHLHGGQVGFNAVVWKVEDVSTEDTQRLKLFYRSIDGEEGYPGNLDVEIIYVLTSDNAFEITYSASTDKSTIINLTHHSYFNLNLSSQADILGHEVQLAASKFIAVDETAIPIGGFNDVDATPFDFRSARKVRDVINGTDIQLIRGRGYDHCWVIDNHSTDLISMANVYDPISGRHMEVFTTEPGVQFYSGNFLDGTLKGKEGIVYQTRMGLCLETQHFPDTPNQKGFPSVKLNPGEVYNSKTMYRFSVQ
jgi:aldose 1-epimerase